MDDTPFQRLGYNVLLVFLFLAFSRIFDVKFGYLHITGMAYRIVFLMVLLSGAIPIPLKSNIGKALLGFTFCIGLSVPFSVWRWGSKGIFQTWLTFSFVAFLAVAGLVSNYQQCFKVVKTLAWAFLVFTIIANVFGTSENGRLFLAQGKFANPNEMAQALLLGLPLWGAIIAVSKSLPGKVFAFGGDGADSSHHVPHRLARRYDRVRGDGSGVISARVDHGQDADYPGRSGFSRHCADYYTGKADFAI
jgi:hypothetical protein